MTQKALSIFLFLLFSIVIAFPGYGNNKIVNTHYKQVQIKAAIPTTFSFILLIKKCLLKGISVVEEERLAEENHTEDEDCNAGSIVEEEITFLITFTINIYPKENIQIFKLTQFDLLNYAYQSVPKPPPESNFIHLV